jgi:hypothetical protein
MQINRRAFLTSSAKVVLTVTTIGSLRIARAHEIGRAEKPWSAALEAKSADPRVRAMAYAILAPNAFNLQPWLAELPGDDLLILRCDLGCRLPQLDANDRMTVITFGNFLELLRMAAAHDGYRLVIERFPMGEPLGQLDGRPIASVRFIRGGATSDSLFAQVTERRTSKRPFESRPVTSAVLNQLCSVSGTTSWLRASNEVALVGAIRGIALQAFAIEQHTPRIKLEQVRITRFGEDEIEACPDGIDLQGDTVETALTEGKLSRLKLADPNSPASKNAENHYLALCNTAAAYVWLSTGGNTRHDQLDAGRDWLRIHLKATELGLSFDPQSPALNDYPEMAQPFQLMHKTLGVAPVRRVQMLSRLGYAAQSPPSPRWAVETRILNI